FICRFYVRTKYSDIHLFDIGRLSDEMADTEYESVLCIKNEVFVYQIPARTSNRGYSYPGIAVEQVLDSSRYFVIRIQDDSGRKAFIGIGFADRGDSFDLLVSMQDHFKTTTYRHPVDILECNARTLSSPDAVSQIFLTKKQKENTSPSNSGKQRPRVQGSGLGILPPPPAGGGRIAPPPRAPSAVAAVPNAELDPLDDTFGSSQPEVTMTTKQNDVDFLLNFESSCSVSSSDSSTSPSLPPPVLQPQKPAKPVESPDPWGDFTSAGGSSSTNKSSQPAGNWVCFE
ncbi:hypothetical protein LSH36_77g03006, partial [Paralvinella palmiformis]